MIMPMKDVSMTVGTVRSSFHSRRGTVCVKDVGRPLCRILHGPLCLWSFHRQQYCQIVLYQDVALISIIIQPTTSFPKPDCMG